MMVWWYEGMERGTNESVYGANSRQRVGGPHYWYERGHVWPSANMILIPTNEIFISWLLQVMSMYKRE